MADLIDRQVLRKAMYHEAMEKDSDEQKWDSGCWIRYKMFERVLDSIPSAQPKIICCMDCKHNSLNRMSGNAFCDLGIGLYQLYDFCSRAERKND